MNVSVEPGKYIVAVSGGVDSMVLLNMLSNIPTLQLIVGHFDHGIRPDAGEDADLVRTASEAYGLPFELGEGKLGTDASEAEARKARYEFLQGLREKHRALGIITAHHQDDVLETAILNLLRGTGRKGLTSLGTSDHVVRPLLHLPKTDIVNYAEQHGILWREDSTNSSDRYTRNYVRQYIVPRFSPEQKAELLAIIHKSQATNAALDSAISELLQSSEALDRHAFIMLPHSAAREVMASWLRVQNLREFDKNTIERLVLAGKTGKPGRAINIYGPHMLVVDKHKLALGVRDR